MTCELLQQNGWFLVTLLGTLLVVLLFVHGAQSLISSLGGNDEGRRWVISLTGCQWKFTLPMFILFSGVLFVSVPQFHATSFGGAYWLWGIIFFSYVWQALSYEFRDQLSHLLGANAFQILLVLNGMVGSVLLGSALATFFEGEFNLWVLVFGFSVFFLARILGILYVKTRVCDADIRSCASVRLMGSTIAFLVLFVTYLVHQMMDFLS